MKAKIKRIENLTKYEGSYFVYFDYINQEKKTIITPKVLKYLGVDKLEVGDTINIVKSIKNNKISYLITNIEK